MKLDIIVPHYREPWNVCRYLFDTLATQRGVDFDNIRLIMVDDGGEDPLQLDGWEQYGEYPFFQKYYIKEHEGVSAARNFGFDKSDADYVMFCDADDGFLNNCGLHMVFTAMEEGYDWIYSDFIEETIDIAGNWALHRHDNDLTFMHGKVYKREFLIEKNIRFVTGMNMHEDGYFNTVAFIESLRSGKQKRITTPFYLWRWNGNSTVRRNREDFVLRTYADVMRTRGAACRELKARGYQEDYEANVVITILNAYYDFQKTAWTAPKNQKNLRNALLAFKGFWDEFKKVFYDQTNIRIAEIAVEARNTARENGLLMEQETLADFIKRVNALKGTV